MLVQGDGAQGHRRDPWAQGSKGTHGSEQKREHPLSLFCQAEHNGGFWDKETHPL